METAAFADSMLLGEDVDSLQANVLKQNVANRMRRIEKQRLFSDKRGSPLIVKYLELAFK
jgi:hypothetical protein